MPTFRKISHVSFSARDAEKSAQFWKDVFGCEDLERVEGPGWTGVLVMHPASATIVEYQQHEGNQGEEFDPRRTGFDHLGLQVGTREELDEWQARFAELGVTHTPVVDREYGSVLTFKDPDRIQFEMFFTADHP
jgi:glyoxylase I family protein